MYKRQTWARAATVAGVIVSSLAPPDQDRLWHQLMELAEFREPDQPGFTRRTFSEPYQRSRAWVKELMEAAGLQVRTDPTGCLLYTSAPARL